METQATRTDEPIRVSIGSEPLQRIPSAVLRHSILSRTARPVEFVESWSPQTGWHPLAESTPKPRGGTAFSHWRWLVPQLYGAGKAIYLDSDQVVLADIGELWDAMPAEKTIAAVCNAVGIFGKKMPEPNHVQTSVMVMDCAKIKDRARMVLQECHRGKLAYRDLMQATWLPRDEVEELEPEWNAFGLCPAGTKLLHWSHVKSQPFRSSKDWPESGPNHPTAAVFWNELRSAVEAKYISTREVAEEVDRGHVAAIYLKRLRRDAA